MCQTVDVLEIEFSDIMDVLEKELNLHTMDVKLPVPQDGRSRSSSNSKMPDDTNYIPESLIAQKLRNGLQSNANNETKCVHIINAFKLIYGKYVDDKNALYMINISSANRKKLKHLFDHKYYQHEMKQKENSDKKRKSLSLSLSLSLSIKSKTKHKHQMQSELEIDNVINKNNTFVINMNNDFSFLNQELKTKIHEIQSKHMTVQDEENDLISWLLRRILIAMKPVIVQIGNLMGDSFDRFVVKQDKDDPIFN